MITNGRHCGALDDATKRDDALLQCAKLQSHIVLHSEPELCVQSRQVVQRCVGESRILGQ